MNKEELLQKDVHLRRKLSNGWLSLPHHRKVTITADFGLIKDNPAPDGEVNFQYFKRILEAGRLYDLWKLIFPDEEVPATNAGDIGHETALQKYREDRVYLKQSVFAIDELREWVRQINNKELMYSKLAEILCAKAYAAYARKYQWYISENESLNKLCKELREEVEGLKKIIELYKTI